VVAHVGQQGDPVQRGDSHGCLLGGQRGVGEGGLDLRMPAQPGRPAVPGLGVGSGQPEPVTQPPLHRRRPGGLVQATALGLTQQRRLRRGGARLHVEQRGDRGLHLRVGELPELRAGHLVQTVGGAANTGEHRVPAHRRCLTHARTLATASDTTLVRAAQ
jgi:hypothetical protein